MNTDTYKIPVVIIVYKRPGHALETLKRIEEYKPELLFVIADGPKPNSPAESQAVLETRQIFENLSWKCEVIRVFAPHNLGLRNRVLTGLDVVFESVDRAVILEDDCLPSPSFFRFCEETLSLYESNDEVALVSGNNFAPSFFRDDSFTFTRHANIWGWATWSRTWREFRNSPTIAELSQKETHEILTQIPGLMKRRAFGQLLRLSGSLDSWAIQFAAYCYMNLKLSIQPSKNLVTNIGFGHESTHTKFESWADELPAEDLRFPLRIPKAVTSSPLSELIGGAIKSLRWLIYPLMHPLEAATRVLRYVVMRKAHKLDENA